MRRSYVSPHQKKTREIIMAMPDDEVARILNDCYRILDELFKETKGKV